MKRGVLLTYRVEVFGLLGCGNRPIGLLYFAFSAREPHSEWGQTPE
jgi:hypothetical protein